MGCNTVPPSVTEIMKMETEQEQVVYLTVGGREFKAKKNLLIEYSDYFRAMFSGNFIEKEQENICIDVVDAGSMEIILRYMELGFIDLSDYPLSVVDLVLSAAVFLQITELTKQIDYCLEEQLSVCNWLEIREIAQKAPSPRLEQVAVTYGLMSFKYMKPEYVPTIELLFWYLSHPYLNAESELQVFRFGVKWCELKHMDAQVLLIILCCLDYSQIDTNEFKDMKENKMMEDEDFICDYSCSQAKDIIANLYEVSKVSEVSIRSIEDNKQLIFARDATMTEERYLMISKIISGSITRNLKFLPAIPMWTNEEKNIEERAELSQNYLYTYTHETGFQQWLEINEKNYWGWNLTNWTPTKIVMCCGEYGRGTGSFMRDVKVYDVLKKEWIHHGVELPLRRHAGIVVLGDELYILGGVGGYRLGSLKPSSEDSGQGSGTSTRLGSLRPSSEDSGQGSGTSTSRRRKLIEVLKRNNHYIPIVARFDRDAASGYLYNNRCSLMVAEKQPDDGRIVLDSAIIYDLKQRTFRKIAKLPDAIQSPAVCVHENVVYATGHKHIYKHVGTGPFERWEKILQTDITPSFMISFNGYIYVAQIYFDILYRFKPGENTALEKFAYLDFPPMALCNTGRKLIGFTGAPSVKVHDLIIIQEITKSSEEGKRLEIRLSKNLNKCGVHTTGSCAVLTDPPPINPGISAFHQEILKTKCPSHPSKTE